MLHVLTVIVMTKDIVHVLRDCVVARRIWSVLRPSSAHDNFFVLSLRDLIMLNFKKNGQWDGNCAWSCIFGVAIWRIFLA